MHERPVSSRQADAIQHGPERRARWYLFAVCGSAIFLLSVALGMRPGESEPMCAALILPASNPPNKNTAEASPIDEIRTAAILTPAVRPFVSKSQSETDLVTHFSRETSATLSPLEETGNQRLMVSYSGDRPEAVKVLNSLVDSYVQILRGRRKEKLEREYQQAVEKAAAAQAHANAARERLMAKRMSAENAAHAEKKASAGAGEAKLPKLRIEPNPAWVELSKQLHEAEQQRRDLLTQLNEVHPRVRDIQFKISAIRQQLSGVPETLTQVGTNPAIQADAAAVQAGKIAQLENEYHTAQLAQQMADQELATAQDRMANSAVDPTRVVLWAAPTQQSGSGVPTVVFGLLMAVVTAGGVALVAVPENPTFRTVELAAETLAVPVVGVIHTSEKSPSLNQADLPGWTRVVQRSAEAVLLLAVVLGMLLWLSGTELSAKVAGGLNAPPTHGAAGR